MGIDWRRTDRDEPVDAAGIDFRTPGRLVVFARLAVIVQSGYAGCRPANRMRRMSPGAITSGLGRSARKAAFAGSWYNACQLGMPNCAAIDVNVSPARTVYLVAISPLGVMHVRSRTPLDSAAVGERRRIHLVTAKFAFGRVSDPPPPLSTLILAVLAGRDTADLIGLLRRHQHRVRARLEVGNVPGGAAPNVLLEHPGAARSP